ncbi:glutathionylspermidine synthase family protein [Heliobacterium gestii]|uniref:Glutathionylspermidine synthase family protein n=1 Tax=Heliomicrobium gestii TaxID=2699 RepID=A0A845LI87_HELGE|nr:glutathionylspermidine synthase family protein [Heliomicrobium gestii]MBM7866107.1 glutathionylspermidine synthase [Heliomicrobium gestii]MZP42566.1 glutathionylspermidine synthase family protein [Heliomicrobium gestii]
MRISPVLFEDREAYLDRWEALVDRFEQDYTFSWAFDGRGQHFLNLHALVLTPEEDRAIREAQARVTELFHSIARFLESNPEALDALGIPDILKPQCLKRPLPYLTALGRFDWYWTGDGPKLLEFNSETPFGQVEACRLQPELARLFHRSLKDPNADLADRIGEGLRESFQRQGGNSESVTAIVGFCADPEEMATLSLIRELADYPCHALIGDVQALSVNHAGRLCLGGAPVDLLQSFYSVEWYARDPGGPQFVDSLDQGLLRLINPPSTLILHSKALFALLWLVAPQLPAPLRQTLERYIPYTALDPDPLLGRPALIKPLHNREGLGIVYTEALSIHEAKRDDAVYQERVDGIAVSFPAMRNGRIRERRLLPTIGAYCAKDEFVGYYTRLSPLIVGPLDVCWAPTLIE